MNLPREYYLSDEIFQMEQERVFSRQWLPAGHVSLLKQPGSYFERHVGGESLLIGRDLDGKLRAFFNVCRHRGYRLVANDESGTCRAYVCPYHHWTYGLDGRLVTVPGCKDGADFSFADYPLHEAKIDSCGGFLFVWLGHEPPPPLLSALGELVDEEALRTCGSERIKLAHREIYTIEANWKAMAENDFECYHCGHGGHPTLGVACDYQAFYADRRGSQHFPLRDGMKTMSADGERVCSRNLGTAKDGFSTGFLVGPCFGGPVLFVDHAVQMELSPLSAARTRFLVEWYVHEDAIEGVDYEPSAVAHAFHVTNLEDKAFGERNFEGIKSSRFSPGPLHPRREDGVIAMYDQYRAMMERPTPTAVGTSHPI